MADVEKIHSLVNDIVTQATGGQLSVLDSTNALSVANTALTTYGYDKMVGAISDMVDKTIIAERPYKGSFAGLRTDSAQFGIVTRKLQFIDLEAEASEVYNSTDGTASDMYARRNAKPLQTIFTGKTEYQSHVTTYDYQLDTAFSSAAELQAYLRGVLTNVSSRHAQEEEGLARTSLLNFMAGKGTIGNGVFPLVTNYNTEMGYSTAKTWADIVSSTDEYNKFIRWAYAYMARISDLMAERHSMYHQNITGKTINKFTPKESQMAFILSEWSHNIDARVKTDAFNKEYLGDLGNVHKVTYWQSPTDTSHISIKPTYLDTDGTVKVGSTYTFSGAAVVGCIIDKDAVGYTQYHNSCETTPHNARGKYTNTWWTREYRYWNDFLENGVVFTLA